MFEKISKALWGTEFSGEHEVEDAPVDTTTNIHVGDARKLLASVDADREIVGRLRRVASTVAEDGEVIFRPGYIRGGNGTTVVMGDPRVVQAVLSCLRVLAEDIEGQAVRKENSLRVAITSDNAINGGNDA